MPKGVYDRSASAWRPKPRAEYPPELVERVRLVYGTGRTMRETAEIVGVGVHVLQRLMPRNGIDRRSTAKRDQDGPANHAWKGDDAGYKAMHLRVARARGKPSRCEDCGTTDPALRYEWANLTGRYEDVFDYRRLCKGCHNRFDARRREVV